ncbi:MAG: WG repeat-containing protein [Cyclobacteriaceae bacterium]
MKPIILTYFLLLFGQLAFAQNSEVWTSFWDKESDLMGFKNSKGEIMIEPKFMGFTIAKSFDNIIAVMEEDNGKYETYYLTKSGKKIGTNSLHIYDNGADCESEGFIRFKDKKSDKVGMFNKNGNISIPAVYDALSRTHNGLIWGLKGAEKKYWDKHKESGCNHYSWKGGQEVLIDTMNNTLIENFTYDNSLNFFTIEKTISPHSDTTRESFLAQNGSYYSFIDFKKEFKQWITKELIDSITPNKLIEASYDTITWESENGWAKTNKNKLIADNFTILKNGLLEILEPKTDYFISTDGLNPFMYEGSEFGKYYNNCGESKDWIYPTMSIIINHKDKNDFTQNHYEFLKTDEGYKLISLVIRDKKMK